MEKYPLRQLAGGLLYGMHGFEAEVEGTIRPSTVTGPIASVYCGANAVKGRAAKAVTFQRI